MTEENNNSSTQAGEWDIFVNRLRELVPPFDPNALNSGEQALKFLGEFAQKVPESLSSGMKTLTETVQELTNVKGVEVKLNSLRSLDVRMHIVREADIPINRDIIGIGKIESIRLSKLIHMQAEIGDDNRDVRAHFREGMALVVSVIFFGTKQVVPLKGTAKLIRDEKGQILIESTTYIPNTEVPVVLTFPLKQVLDEVRKNYKF